MLKQLRVRLTLLYLFASIVLSLAVGGGTYSLVNYYFRTVNDQALWVKMGLQFAYLGIPLPLDLYEAVKREGLVITNPIEVDEEDDDTESLEEEHHEGLQESELADIFVLPLTSEGTLLPSLKSQYSVQAVDMDAVLAAKQNGYDFRTGTTTDGVPVRLFTYLVPEGELAEVIQIGRYLSAQNRVLQQLLNTMILLGGLVTILFGLASWILAGRTIKPSQRAWDKQQIFIANASHELRAPLTLIHAGVELGLRKAESLEQKELLSDVLSDANYMKKLIEDLLLLSRLDTDAVKINLQSLNTTVFALETLRQVERLAETQSITLLQSIEELNILADPVRLRQVLLIIFDNAIRNTPTNGKISFQVKRSDDSAVFSISDTGKGIPIELLDKIFERFYKVDDQSSLEYRGSGLGLSIAKSLVETQHGSIKITSNPGQGTQVDLTFPLVL